MAGAWRLVDLAVLGQQVLAQPQAVLVVLAMTSAFSLVVQQRFGQQVVVVVARLLAVLVVILRLVQMLVQLTRHQVQVQRIRVQVAVQA